MGRIADLESQLATGSNLLRSWLLSVPMLVYLLLTLFLFAPMCLVSESSADVIPFLPLLFFGLTLCSGAWLGTRSAAPRSLSFFLVGFLIGGIVGTAPVVCLLLR